MDRDNYSVFDPKNSKTKILCWSSWCSGFGFEFGNVLLYSCQFAGSMWDKWVQTCCSLSVISSEDHVS